MNRIKAWKPMLDKFSARLSFWKSKNLSFGGRVTLAKYVLGSLPLYYLSIFSAPKGVIDAMKKIRRIFIWGGTEDKSKISWVSWEKITAPKIVGGLGLGSIKATNLSLLCKWWWRIKIEPESLWALVIKGLHNTRELRGNRISSPSMTGTWRAIDKCGNYLEKINIKRSDVVRISETGGGWESDYATDGVFSAHMLRSRVERANHWIADCFFPWYNSIPSKVSCFVWRAIQNRIPVYSELTKRGIDCGGAICSACINETESVEHLLIGCPFAKVVWFRVSKWCGLPLHEEISVRNIINCVIKRGRGLKQNLKTYLAIVFGSFWCIWRARNDRVFQANMVNPNAVFLTIRSMVFLWIKHRVCKGKLNWGDWEICPFYFL